MNLQEFFKENPKVALAFSGGVDSSYLLYAAMKYGADVKAYSGQMYCLTRLWFPTRLTAAITARKLSST